jgi:hypothetical protein
MHYVGQAGDEVPLDQVPQTTELGVVWLRAYLAHREQFDVSDAALRELLRQWRASGRATLDLGSTCVQIWRNSLYFESQSESAPQSLSDITTVLPARVPWQRHQLDLTPAAADDMDAIAYVGDLR